MKLLITKTIANIALVTLAMTVNLICQTKNNKVKSINLVSRKFVSTAYCLRGKTASGKLVRSGLVAADIRIFPLGTKILINGKNYLVADTGSAIKGNRLDIWMNSCQEAKLYGKRIVNVTQL